MFYESHAPMHSESPNLQSRIRFSLLVLLVANAVFILVDLFGRESFDARIWPSRALQIVAVATYFAWIRKERTRGALIAGTLLVGVIVYTTMTVSWSIRSGAEGIRPAILATAFCTAALIPWGAWAQAASAALGAATMSVHALATVGFAGFPPGPDSVATLLALGVSVLVARELQRQRDLADQQQAERAATIVELRESESRFRGAFDNAPIGMALVGLDGRWLKVNRRICDIVGYSEDELRATDFQSITHPDDLDLDLELLRETLAGRRDGYQLDKRYIHKRGHVVWVLLAVSLIRRPDGSPSYFVSQVEDVTSRVMAEQALATARDEALRASQTKSEFLATMSHELRTPLGAIIGMADILAETELQEEQREFVDVIHRSSVALLDIINDVLDLSRIEAGRIQWHTSDIDVRKLVQESAELFRAEMQQRGLAWTATVDASVPQRVRGDEARLRQVLINLIGNAVKFTHAGRVDVELHAVPQEDGRIAIHGRVSDTGIGIAADQQQRIFDAFVQADSTTSRAYGGSGLGLAICQHLTKCMGGNIEIDSEVGVGTVVRFFVVFDEIAAASTTSALPDEPNPEEPVERRPASGRILVVDDNEANRRILERMLQRLGYAVDVAVDGDGALAQLAAAPFDAVLMDCAMPGRDGYATTRELRTREAERAARIPVIALTADVSSGARNRCLDAGMDDYLSKPVRREQLATCLDRWLAPHTSAADSSVEDCTARASHSPA